MEASVTSRSAQVLFRYRTGDVLSAWMPSDQLRAHAADGRIKPESSIQQVGKEEWVPASKIPKLWVGAAAGSGGGAAGASGSAAGADAMEDSRYGESGGPGDSRAASRNGGQGGAAASEQAGTGQPTHPHHMRLGESLQHLLTRAALGHVTVCAPEFAQPEKAMLAGVTVDAFALEFDGCSTVVYVPWSQLRCVALPSAAAHSTKRITEQAGGLILEIERVPLSVAKAVQAAQET